MWEPLQATSDPGRGLPLLVGPLWKGYRPRVRPKREPKGTKRTSRHLGTKWATVRKTLIRVIKLAVPSLLQEREAPRLQRGLPVTSGLPRRPRLMGGGSRAVSSRSLRTQLPPPSNLDSLMRWVALATLLLVV